VESHAEERIGLRQKRRTPARSTATSILCPEAPVDYVKCWDCGPSPLYPVVIALVLLGLLLMVWKTLRPPRPPSWWDKSGR